VKAKIVGIAIILINIFWMFHHLRYLYLYQNPDIFWFYMYPNWYLILNSFIGLIGIIIGIRVYQERLKIIYGIFITVLLIGAGLTTDIIRNF